MSNEKLKGSFCVLLTMALVGCVLWALRALVPSVADTVLWSVAGFLCLLVALLEVAAVVQFVWDRFTRPRRKRRDFDSALESGATVQDVYDLLVNARYDVECLHYWLLGS